MKVELTTLASFEYMFDEVRHDYSGRGMYGKKCIAIVTGESAWSVRGILEYEKTDPAIDGDEYGEMIDYMLEHEPVTDSMGYDTVYYWPGLSLKED